jgi:hypothetical protein
MVTELGIVVFYDEARGKGLLLTASGQAIHFLRHRLKGYAAGITPCPQWILEVTYHLDTSSYKCKQVASADSIDLPLEVDANAEREDLLELYNENEARRHEEKFSRIAVQTF